MEEVWKDMNLASLNEQNTRPITITNRSNFGNAILQDFLTRPLDSSSSSSSSSNSSNSSSVVSENVSLYCPVSSSSTPPLVTALSLNSRPDFHVHPLIIHKNNSQLLHQHQHQHQHQHHHQQQHHRHINASNVSSFVNPSLPPFDRNVGSASNSFTCFGKRFGEPPDVSPVERRNKRMIKNRESAARSRARKQAYTNELEQKVQLLMEENARLKRHQEELWEAASGQQKKKNNLYRTLTAPF